MSTTTAYEIIIAICFGLNGIIEMIEGDVSTGLLLFLVIVLIWLERHYRKLAGGLR